MHIMGINCGLNSSICLLKNNKAVFAIQEERLNRVKNQPGFPSKSIETILDRKGLKIDDIDIFAFGTENSKIHATRKEQLQKFNKLYDEIKSGWYGHRKNILSRFAHLVSSSMRNSKQDGKSLDDLIKEYGIEKKAVKFDNQRAHAAASYYGLVKDYEKKYLIFNMDSGRDGKSSSIFTAENGKLKELVSSDSFSIASLYAHITYILGFIPFEHENKLMDLSPYAQKIYGELVSDIFTKYISFDKSNPLKFSNGEKYSTGNSSFYRKIVEDIFQSTLNLRFDTLSAGLQKFAEDMTVKWVKNAVAQTGIKNILLSGGFFSNLRVNQGLSNLSEIESINCFPSCGDESRAFGAAFLAYNQSKKTMESNIDFGNFFLGTDASDDLNDTMQEYASELNFRISHNINYETAKMLADGKILARCSGKLEFGARALGNRSILSAPNKTNTVEKINNAIKKRNFWMPCSVAILQEDSDKIIEIPNSLKKIMPPYMMFSYNVKKSACKNIEAAIHPVDQISKVQLVNSESYPEFFEIITDFKKLTGIPAILNTSFNIHGYPIVNSSKNAIEVFLESGLDILIINDYIITKKS